MKKICLLFVLLFSSALFGADLDLDGVCTMLGQTPNTVGDFQQIKTIKSNGRQLKSSGKFIISNLGIVWKTEKPFGSCAIFTKDKMIQVSNKGKVSVMDGKDNLMFENISSTMIAVFSGNSEILKNNFQTDFSYDDKENWELKLIPNDETIKAVMASFTLTGTVNGDDISLMSLEMSEASGNTIQYKFSNQRYPKELTADEKEYFSLK